MFMANMAIKENTLLKLREYKIHPRETDNDCLSRMIVQIEDTNKPVPR